MSRNLSGTRYLVMMLVIALPIVALGSISGIEDLVYQIKQRNSFYRIKANRLQRGRSSSNNWE